MKCLADILREYGRGMPLKNLRMLSNFIVKSSMLGQYSDRETASFAKDLKLWREFTFGDQRLNAVGARMANIQNEAVDGALKDPKAFMKTNNDVFEQLWIDADGSYWNINGTEPIISGGALHKYYNLELSEDGNTATVSLGICKNISIEGDAANKYGVATIVQRSTVDLTKDIPEITNVTFSQKFTSDIKGLDPKDYLFS